MLLITRGTVQAVARAAFYWASELRHRKMLLEKIDHLDLDIAQKSAIEHVALHPGKMESTCKAIASDCSVMQFRFVVPNVMFKSRKHGQSTPYCGWTNSCTTLEPWGKPLFVGIYRESSCQGFCTVRNGFRNHPQHVSTVESSRIWISVGGGRGGMYFFQRRLRKCSRNL